MRVIQSERWTVAIIEEGERSLGRKLIVNNDSESEIEIYDRNQASAYEDKYHTYKHGAFITSYYLEDFMQVDGTLDLWAGYLMPERDVRAIQALILEG